VVTENFTTDWSRIAAACDATAELIRHWRNEPDDTARETKARLAVIALKELLGDA
jgi:hypothetical protein